MASLNTFAILQWKVDRSERAAVVNCEKVAQFTMYVPDGAGTTDPQVISRYIHETAKDKVAADRLLTLTEEGLLTVVTVQKTAVTVPPVPPSTRVETLKTS